MVTTGRKTPGTARKTMKRKPLAADHFGATYRVAIAVIPDADVRARVQALLDDAPNVVAVAEKRAARKLLALALQSPAVRQTLVRIVECWPRRRKWQRHYRLACGRRAGRRTETGEAARGGPCS